MEHTEGKWEIERREQEHTVKDDLFIVTGEYNIASVQGHFDNAEANAQRIVACVNACEGMSAEEMKDIDKEGGLKSFLLKAYEDLNIVEICIDKKNAQLSQLSTITKQRDELKESNENLLDNLKVTNLLLQQKCASEDVVDLHHTAEMEKFIKRIEGGE